jgi:hypothetical protein
VLLCCTQAFKLGVLRNEIPYFFAGTCVCNLKEMQSNLVGGITQVLALTFIPYVIKVTLNLLLQFLLRCFIYEVKVTPALATSSGL